MSRFLSFRLVRGLLALACVLLGGWILPGSEVRASAKAGEVSGEQVADAVQRFYDQTTAVEASFFQTYFNRIYKRYDRSKGRVRFQKPGKMRWDYARPNGKILVSDGSTLKVFEPGDDGEPGQVFEQPMTESQLPQALAFLTGSGRLQDDFAFRLLDAKAQGFQRGYVLELRPKADSPHYDRILFYVDADPTRAGLVHRVLIIDPEGNRNRFDFSELRFNRPVDPKLFRFTPPVGTRKVTP